MSSKDLRGLLGSPEQREAFAGKVSTPPPAKKPGRPPSAVKPALDVSVQEGAELSSPSKPKPGRPPKSKVVSEPAVTRESVEIEPGLELLRVSEPSAPPKPRPGRPPKEKAKDEAEDTQPKAKPGRPFAKPKERTEVAANKPKASVGRPPSKKDLEIDVAAPKPKAPLGRRPGKKDVDSEPKPEPKSVGRPRVRAAVPAEEDELRVVPRLGRPNSTAEEKLRKSLTQQRAKELAAEEAKLLGEQTLLEKMLGKTARLQEKIAKRANAVSKLIAGGAADERTAVEQYCAEVGRAKGIEFGPLGGRPPTGKQRGRVEDGSDPLRKSNRRLPYQPARKNEFSKASQLALVRDMDKILKEGQHGTIDEPSFWEYMFTLSGHSQVFLLSRWAERAEIEKQCAELRIGEQRSGPLHPGVKSVHRNLGGTYKSNAERRYSLGIRGSGGGMQITT